MNKPTVVLVDDEQTLRENLEAVLTEDGQFDVISCADGETALKALREHPAEALITDLRMPGLAGMDLIDRAIDVAPQAVIIVITAFGEVETAVAAMKKGVGDYICKPLVLEDVVFRLKRLLAHDDLVRENEFLREEVRGRYDPSKLIGESASMRAIKSRIERIGSTMSNVLILGESGTGKEVIARAIHYVAATAHRPFVVVNCRGLENALTKSELFGYRRGSFDGADADRIGYLESANGGTLFLDNVGILPANGQTALLEALDDRAVTRLGESKVRPIHLRVIAAWNRDLSTAVQCGGFRADLFDRLGAVLITLAPLRERPEDIPALADHFLADYNAELNAHCPGFSPEARDALLRHDWPGNVRELANAVERALIVADGRLIGVDDLGLSQRTARTGQRDTLDLRTATRQFEAGHIAEVVARVGGNKVEAARLLGIGLSSLYRKLDELKSHNASNVGSPHA